MLNQPLLVLAAFPRTLLLIGLLIVIVAIWITVQEAGCLFLSGAATWAAVPFLAGLEDKFCPDLKTPEPAIFQVSFLHLSESVPQMMHDASAGKDYGGWGSDGPPKLATWDTDGPVADFCVEMDKIYAVTAPFFLGLENHQREAIYLRMDIEKYRPSKQKWNLWHETLSLVISIQTLRDHLKELGRNLKALLQSSLREHQAILQAIKTTNADSTTKRANQNTLIDRKVVEEALASLENKADGTAQQVLVGAEGSRGEHDLNMIQLGQMRPVVANVKAVWSITSLAGSTIKRLTQAIEINIGHLERILTTLEGIAEASDSGLLGMLEDRLLQVLDDFLQGVERNFKFFGEENSNEGRG
ncbi:hypothetical protein ACHAQA_008667 [Verticillium albo-atrum]